MQCPACRTENDADAGFCDHCGQQLVPSPSHPPKKGGRGAGTWIAVAVPGFLVICAVLFLLVPFLSGPGYDCSVTTGYVAIQNVPGSDAYVSIVDRNDNIVKTVYIAAGSRGAIRDICNGRYYLYYVTGRQWDSSSESFAVATDSGHFIDPFDFDGSNYYEVSLVPGSGNARTSGSGYNESGRTPAPA